MKKLLLILLSVFNYSIANEILIIKFNDEAKEWMAASPRVLDFNVKYDLESATKLLSSCLDHLCKYNAENSIEIIDVKSGNYMKERGGFLPTYSMDNVSVLDSITLSVPEELVIQTKEIYKRLTIKDDTQVVKPTNFIDLQILRRSFLSIAIVGFIFLLSRAITTNLQ